MEERVKNITSEVYEELMKLFGGKIGRIILYGSYARGNIWIRQGQTQHYVPQSLLKVDGCFLA